jgi:choline dehydrogenase-like flavoprotein
MRGMPRDLPQWGREYKKNLAEYFSRTMASMSHTTCLPQLQNSISLDPAVKDAWGLPAMRVTFKLHADDVATMKFILARQLEVLDAAGARETWTNGVRDVSGSVHLMGTCRMGNDPKQSVVDKYHRAHDVPNLFVVDGSSFVTSGRQQPTCTIQALAYRAADHIVKSARAGEM